MTGHRSEKHITVATFEKCYLISNIPSIFVFFIQQVARKCLIGKIVFH